MSHFDIHNKNKIHSGFKIPENYFEQFENKILSQIEEKKPIKVISIWKQKRIWVSSVAAIVLLSIGTPYYLSLNSKNNTIDTEILETYIVMQPSMNSYEIGNQLTDEDMEVLEADLALNDKEIEEYLLNESELDLY